MSCGDKCKCDCCKAKKKAAAAAKRRNKAKGPTVKKVQERGSNAAPSIMIHNTKSNKSNALPTLNVSNHPSTIPKNIATQTGDLIEQRTVTTTGTQTLPDLPDLQQNMTAPPRPAKYIRQPVSISTREPTMAVIEPPSRYAEHIENITDAMATQRHNEERERLGIRHVVRIRRPQRSPPAIPSLPDLPDLQEGMTGRPAKLATPRTEEMETQTGEMETQTGEAPVGTRVTRQFMLVPEKRGGGKKKTSSEHISDD